jgi:hypothetical protein
LFKTLTDWTHWSDWHARTFAYSGKQGRLLYDDSHEDDTAIAHFYQKLFKLAELMNLEEARIIAKNRVEFMKKYLEEFFLEWKKKGQTLSLTFLFYKNLFLSSGKTTGTKAKPFVPFSNSTNTATYVPAS